MQLTNLREGTNKIVTENEIRGFVPYENLLDVVDEWEKKWMDMMEGLNQNDGKNHPANAFDTDGFAYTRPIRVGFSK